MSRISRENILAAYGDQAVYASDQAMFTEDGYSLLSPGQLAVWDPVTLKSLGAGITPATKGRIVISVGVDEKTIKSCFGDELYGNNIQAVTCEPSRCGAANVWDILWNDVSCDEDYTINITRKDDATQNSYPYNKPATYSYTVKASTCACSSCDSGVDGRLLACALRDSINAKRSATTKLSTFLPSKLNTQSKGFTAHVLYGGDNPDSDTNATTYVFCINPVVEATCDGNCIHMDKLVKGISFTEAGEEDPTEVAITSTAYTTPTPDQGFLYDIDRIVAQINTALDGNGSAAIIRGAGGCCPFKLEINSCYTDIQLWSDDFTTEIEPCETYNPFDPADFPITSEHSCKNCDTAPTRTFTRGLRIISDPVILPCGDNPDLNPKVMKTIDLNVFAVGGFSCAQTYIRETQASVIPENLGYDWIVRDYLSENGGTGRGQDAFEHLGYGAAGYPLGRGRSGGIQPIKCGDTFCSYAIAHTLPHTDPGVRGVPHATRGTTIVLIPSEDSVTRADFEALLNPYISAANPIIKTTVTCASDQDQTESPRYPDSNGYIL